MLINVFWNAINPNHITSIEQRDRSPERNTNNYGVEINLVDGKNAFIQGKEVQEVLDEIEKQTTTNSDVASLARAIGELSTICNGLCARLDVLENIKNQRA